jgi:hypothetical protein
MQGHTAHRNPRRKRRGKLNTLHARLRDTKIEMALWFWFYLLTTLTFFFLIYFYLQPSVSAWLWRDYLLAKTLHFAGLGSIPIPGWHVPDVVLDFASEKLPAATVAAWDSHFLVFANSPLASACLVVLVFVFVKRIEK